MTQRPERSGLPSRPRGVGAVGFALPSRVRGMPDVGYPSHCACIWSDKIAETTSAQILGFSTDFGLV